MTRLRALSSPYKTPMLYRSSKALHFSCSVIPLPSGKVNRHHLDFFSLSIIDLALSPSQGS